ncbi:MAG: hypothetical protein P8J32_08560 [bacterium]|jgi:hypothetical protein|nr:hypothetical protein [bacterium]
MKEFLGKNFGFLLLLSLFPIGYLTSIRFAAEAALIYFGLFMLVEMIKKQMMESASYFNNPNRLTHIWQGTKAEGLKPQMRIIRLCHIHGEDFAADIGFEMPLPILGNLFWLFGHAKSVNGEIVIRTWVSYKATMFLFKGSYDADMIEITHGDVVQYLTPHQTFWPHWYQQIWPLYYFV